MTDAGLVHLDAEVVDRRVVQGVRDERLAVTEADVQHAPRGAAEQLVEVEPPGRLGDAEARQQLGEGAALGGRGSAGPADEATDLAQPDRCRAGGFHAFPCWSNRGGCRLYLIGLRV